MATLDPGVQPRRASLLESAFGIAFQNLPSTFLAAATVATAAWLLAFWSLVLRARVSTGVWPQPRSGSLFDYRPSTVDPHVFEAHGGFVWAAFFAMYYAVPFALLVLLVSLPFRSLRQDHRLVGAFALVVALAATTWFLDPGNFFLWFID